MRRTHDDRDRLVAECLGRTLRHIREDLHLSARAVAEWSDGRLHGNTVLSYERAERVMHVPALFDLCDAYGIDPADVVAMAKAAVDAIREHEQETAA